MLTKLVAMALAGGSLAITVDIVAPDEAEAQVRERRVERLRTTPRGDVSGLRERRVEPGSRSRFTQVTRPDGAQASRDFQQNWGRTDTGFFADRSVDREFFDGTSRGYNLNRDLNVETQTATRDFDAYFRDGTTADGTRTIQRLDEGFYQVDRAGTNREGESYENTRFIDLNAPPPAPEDDN